MVIVFIYLRMTMSPEKPRTASVEAPIEKTVITDAALLEKDNPAFYQGVKNGDVVFRYSDRLDLYRPTESRVLRSVSVSP